MVSNVIFQTPPHCFYRNSAQTRTNERLESFLSLFVQIFSTLTSPRSSDADGRRATSQQQQQRQGLQIAGIRFPLPSAAQHPPAAQGAGGGVGGGLINGSLAQQQQAYALIISSIFNIHNALLISDAPQQHCCFSTFKDWSRRLQVKSEHG